MKLISLQLLGLISFLAANYSLADADQWTLAYSVRLQIAQGKSVWVAPEFTSIQGRYFQLRAAVEASCPQVPYMSVQLRHADTLQWEYAPNTNGILTYSGGPINSVRYEIDQPWYAVETCSVNLYVEPGTVDPNPAEETLAGAIPFAGGFQQAMTLELNPPPFITGFRVAVPEYCSQMEVLEAFTITEGVADKAKLVDKTKNIFSVNQGSGSRISKIQLSLVGPVDIKCELPVYVTKK